MKTRFQWFFVWGALLVGSSAFASSSCTLHREGDVNHLIKVENVNLVEGFELYNYFSDDREFRLVFSCLKGDAVEVAVLRKDKPLLSLSVLVQEGDGLILHADAFQEDGRQVTLVCTTRT